MSNIANENTLLQASEVIRSYGFSDSSSLIDLLCRVVMTKQMLGDKDNEAHIVYRTMQEVSVSLPRFPGDAELFFSIYRVLSKIDERGILSFMKIASEGRELYVPDVLTDKFSEYVDADVSSILVAKTVV